jgi:hypothetical protein
MTMWQKLILPNRKKYPLVDGETYKVRMVCGISAFGKDLYDEFECVWRQGLGLWIVKKDFEVYEWVDMDDVWVED